MKWARPLEYGLIAAGIAIAITLPSKVSAPR